MRLLAVVFCSALAAGCATKRGSAVAGASASPGGGLAQSRVEPSATDLLGKPIDGGPDVQPVIEDQASGREILGSSDGGPLADVYFLYNEATISDEARATLSRHAEWLKQNPATRVTIEGHCDERGTVEYNLALGDLRAQAVREYLVGLGVPADRLAPLSYGKEKPIDTTLTEAAFSKNRRAHFVVSR